jgi:hypothetical protein
MGAGLTFPISVLIVFGLFGAGSPGVCQCRTAHFETEMRLGLRSFYFRAEPLLHVICNHLESCNEQRLSFITLSDKFRQIIHTRLGLNLSSFRVRS